MTIHQNFESIKGNDVLEFFQSFTRIFDQKEANRSRDSRRKYKFEATDKLTKLLQHQPKDLESAMIGRKYYTLKYFTHVEAGKKCFQNYPKFFGSRAILLDRFEQDYNNGTLERFNPQNHPRPKVQPVKASSYTVKRKKHPDGTVRIHICNDIGILESRPRGAKSSHVFPLSGLILENGDLLMLGSLEDKSLFLSLLT